MAHGKSALLLSTNQQDTTFEAILDITRHAVTKINCQPLWSEVERSALRDSILCPTAEAVALTEKPEVVAATRGPLGSYFKVPDHIALEDATTKRSLPELRAFADRVGYPVVVKGPRQGAIVCYSWLQVRAVLTTQQFLQGGFIQKCERGFEKCLAFAAFEGQLLGTFYSGMCCIIVSHSRLCRLLCDVERLHHGPRQSVERRNRASACRPRSRAGRVHPPD